MSGSDRWTVSPGAGPDLLLSPSSWSPPGVILVTGLNTLSRARRGLGGGWGPHSSPLSDQITEAVQVEIVESYDFA